MKIFMIATSILEYSIQLANGIGQNKKVTIALSKSSGEKLIDEFSLFFSKCRFNKILVPHYKFSDPRQIITALSLYGKIRRKNPDVIHITAPDFMEILIALLIARICLKVPIIVTLHDAAPHPGDDLPCRKKILIATMMSMADQFIVHGQSIVDQVVDKYNIDRKILNIVPHGNYDLYKHMPKPVKTKKYVPGTILFFGRMKHYKGLSILIEAASIIKKQRKNFKIIIAGRGPELDRLMPELEQNSFFEIHNQFIPFTAVSDLFSSAHVVVLPYIEASQSGPLNLAFSFGRPVVASNVGAMAEAFNNGVEGLLIPPNDPLALADGLLKMLDNPKLSEKMGKAGLKRSKKFYSWEGSIASKTTQVYKKAIKNYNIKRYNPFFQRVTTALKIIRSN